MSWPGRKTWAEVIRISDNVSRRRYGRSESIIRITDFSCGEIGSRAFSVDGDHKKLIADWVARGLQKPGKTQHGLAQAMGITQPQIYRLLHAERSLRAEEIPAVERYLDEPFPYPQIAIGIITDAPSMGGQMPVLGRVAAGVWMEQESAVDAEIATIPMAADPAFPQRRQFAVQVYGDSMDKVLPDGAYAIVVAADGQQPNHNDLVIVRRSRGGLIERTIKRFALTASGAELRPESQNPQHKPLLLTGDDDTTIEIEGFVVGRYERLRP